VKPPDHPSNKRIVLPGDGPLCARCMQHKSNHAPGPPSPPHIPGVNVPSWRERRPAICNDFLIDAPPEKEAPYG
jgi:hypothetical protein